MTTKDDKTLMLLNGLREIFANSPDDKPTVMRYALRRIIAGKLSIVDQHTTNGWVNLLLNKGYISPNPTSEFIETTVKGTERTYFDEKVTETKKMFIPNNNTRYYINVDEVLKEIARLQKLQKQPTRTTPLTDFLKPVRAMVQEEKAV